MHNIIMMNLRLSNVLLWTLFILGNYHMANSDTYFEDLNIIYLNEDYVVKETFDVSINYQPNGQNTISVLVDLIKEIPEDIEAKMNVTTRSFGLVTKIMSLEGKVCDPKGLERYYDLIIKKPFGITTCPPKKGRYEMESMKPDLSIIKLPGILKGTILTVNLVLFAPAEKLFEVQVFISL